MTAQTLDEMEFERGIWGAAIEGDAERVRAAIQKGRSSSSSAADVRDAAGYTALHYAARGGHSDVVRLLLSAGASVDATTAAGGATPLQRAAYAGRRECVRLLLGENCELFSCFA